MKLHVSSINEFVEFLGTIVKIVPGIDQGCKFICDSAGTDVKILNTETGFVRVFLKTNILKTSSQKESLTFCFKSIPTLYKSFKLLQSEFSGTDSLHFNCTESNISFNENGVKFKLSTVKEEVVAKFVTEDIKTKLSELCHFDTSSEKIQKLIKLSSITKNAENKVYLYIENTNVIGELDDRSNSYNDSVGIPISNSFAGQMDSVIVSSVDNFRIFSIIPSEMITVKIMSVGNDKRFFLVESKLENSSGAFITAKVIAPSIKG